ncbi:MAG TPA: DUF6600 domain-containing protein [Bryobacteraceae bacterium]|nr:DUF6600 domain-containing protein [Bryobacteraceae bacterium]
MTLRGFPSLGSAILTGLFSCLLTGPAFAQQAVPPELTDAESASHGVGRISVLSGEVSVSRKETGGEYVAAALNAPLVTGDGVSTGPSGRAEVQFDAANFLRMGHDSDVKITDLQQNRVGMQLARGTVTYRVLRESNAQVEIATPTVSVRPVNRGEVRVTVLDDGQTEITVRSGQVEIYTPRGAETLSAGQTMIARGPASDPEFQITAAIPRDAWDEWCAGRDRTLESSRSYQYVSSDVYGAEDLDAYGEWTTEPGYGEVWRPQVAAGWAPYRDGRWTYLDYYGWTWLGDEPWGWAPYHYGNWFYGSSGWCWYPGSRYSRYYWRPAVVGFFGFGGRSSSFGFGFGNVGWVPLAPFETYRPWYGRGRGFSVVNDYNIYSSFRNARHNGITGISAGSFAGGRFGRNFSVSRNQLGQAGLVNGGLPFRASGGGLRFSDRQASYVPRTNTFSRQFSSRRGNASTFAGVGGSTGFGRGSAIQQGSSPGWSRFNGQRGGSSGFQSTLGGRDSGTSRFNGQRGGSSGFQSTPGSRDSGWSRFNGQRGGSSGFQSTPGSRDSGWSRFNGQRGGSSGFQSTPGSRDSGTSQFNGQRGSSGFQSMPGSRDSGWSRFNGQRGGSSGLQSTPESRDSGTSRFNGQRGSSGLQSTAGSRDSAWSRFNGQRGGSSGFQSTPGSRDSGTSRFNGQRGSSGFQSTPGSRDSGWSRFNGQRGGSAGLQSTPGSRDSGTSRFNGQRGSSGFQSMPGSRDSGGSRFNGQRAVPQPGPSYRDPGGSRYGGAGGGTAIPNYRDRGSAFGGSRRESFSAPRSGGGSSGFQAAPRSMQRGGGTPGMSMPRQSAPTRSFENRSSGNHYQPRGGGGPVYHNAPSSRGGGSQRSFSAPQSGGGGGGNRGGDGGNSGGRSGGHSGRHSR